MILRAICLPRWSTGKVGQFRECEGNLLNMIYGVSVNGFRDFEWNYDIIYRVGSGMVEGMLLVREK